MVVEAYSAVDTRSRSDQVRDRILALIRSGHIKPGEQLPPQRELAQHFGVGMSSIREAIQSLVGQGTLETRHGKGVFVRQLSMGTATHLASDSIRLTPEDSLQLLEARTMIETNAARLAAERHSSEDLEQMAQAIERSRECILQDDIEHLILADLEFHAAVVRGAHNEIVAGMLASIGDLLRRDRFESYRHGQGPGTLVWTHEAIFRAIAAGDAEGAEEQMRAHLEMVRQQVRRRESH